VSTVKEKKKADTTIMEKEPTTGQIKKPFTAGDCKSCNGTDTIIEYPSMLGAKQCKKCGAWSDMKRFVEANS